MLLFDTVGVYQPRSTASQTRVRTELKLVSTSVGASLLMGCDVRSLDSRCASYGGTYFLNVATRYGIDLIGSLFSDEVRFEEIFVGAGFLARDVVYLKGLSIVGGVVHGQFHMPRTDVQGLLHIDGIDVRRGMDLHDGTYGRVNILGSEVGRRLDIRASSLRSLDLSGTTVRGPLRLASPGRRVDWGSPRAEPRFIAQNTRVETLQDTEDSWPRWLGRALTVLNTIISADTAAAPRTRLTCGDRVVQSVARRR